VVDVLSGEVERISPLASGGCEPRFSPDGKKVVYVSRRHLKTTSRLVEHDLKNHEERGLVDWPALNYDPVYSPDGSELAFASDITGEWVVYRQRLADGRAYRLTFRKGAARYPTTDRPCGSVSQTRAGERAGARLGTGHEGLHPGVR